MSGMSLDEMFGLSSSLYHRRFKAAQQMQSLLASMQLHQRTMKPLRTETGSNEDSASEECDTDDGSSSNANVDSAGEEDSDSDADTRSACVNKDSLAPAARVPLDGTVAQQDLQNKKERLDKDGYPMPSIHFSSAYDSHRHRIDPSDRVLLSLGVSKLSRALLVTLAPDLDDSGSDCGTAFFVNPECFQKRLPKDMKFPEDLVYIMVCSRSRHAQLRHSVCSC
jgi:hypothetical protein